MKKLFTLTFFAMLASFASFAVTPIIGADSMCVGSTVALTDATPGGVWSCSVTAIAVVGSSSGVVTGMSAGTATVTYTVAGISVYQTEYIVAMPTPIIGVSHECIGSTTTFSDATPGGTWDSFIPSIATIGSGTGICTGVNYGSTTIMYSIGGMCAVYVSDTVPAPAIYTGITGPSSVCVGSTISLTDATGGGTWGSLSTALATISSGGVLTGVSSGTVTIGYYVTTLCGVASTFATVTVMSSVSSGTISGASTVMATATTTLTETVSGGTWSSSNTAVATVDPITGVVTGVAAGTATISYTVAGCGGPVYATTPMTVTAYDEISGSVLFTGSPYYGPVKVWLITYNPGTLILTAIDSTTVYSSGSSANFIFNNEPTDSFRIKAADTATSGFGYIPTYHTSSYYWYGATVLPHVNGTVDAGQNITMMTGTLTTGSGFIGGNVTTGANKGTGGSAPAVGLTMYLFNSAGTLMQNTKTDASGNYSFGSLTAGTYTVFPEDLQYITTPYTSINLPTSTSSVTTASFIQHTVSYTITPLSALAVNNYNAASSVFVFPNPSNGRLNIQWNTIASETGAVSVSDVTGREVYNSTITMTQGTGVKQADLSGLTNGVYIINVKSNSVNYASKVNIQH